MTSSPSGGEERHSLCNGLTGAYSVSLHVFAIFLILFVSLLGTVMPIMTKYVSLFRENPFVFIVGKTAATGVLLSVSTIHLIFEGAEAFREECVSAFFHDYEPFYLLFALIAVLAMQAVDLQLAAIAERWLKANRVGHNEDDRVVIVDGEKLDGDTAAVVPSVLSDAADPAHASSLEEPGLQSPRSHAVVPSNGPHSHSTGDGDTHGHQHLLVQVPLDMGSIRRIISAVCMEFGVTLHSIFVGLAMGLTTDNELKPLLFALVFHQLFEGMAMGSRLVDAQFSGNLETYLALVFSFSAPAGMALGTAAASVSPLAMSGSAFVTMMAILDSLCGGILLYLAFTLLLGDFVADLKQHCADDLPGSQMRKVVLFTALWVGMGLMAYVGKWL